MARRKAHSDKIPTPVLERRYRKLMRLLAKRKGRAGGGKTVPYHVLEARAIRLGNIIERRGGKAA